ncbi:hypothetical protein BZA05DRAFT_395819 [Tricharina praecox]|uniref:uncharacterized protein n=1 Tax=Tricharina praecox TaxID=43433 RepID=UPI0022209184|nr:uncharacterized protein BZA05DRAFT_395819 [Tricharina praecox]KAI5853370.1 hypothetical protein BZA05DRAFT_395819 [Tricharina praecox]
MVGKAGSRCRLRCSSSRPPWIIFFCFFLPSSWILRGVLSGPLSVVPASTGHFAEIWGVLTGMYMCVLPLFPLVAPLFNGGEYYYDDYTQSRSHSALLFVFVFSSFFSSSPCWCFFFFLFGFPQEAAE